ncbi:MAG TPA: hypothetical protein VLA61_19220 [Ideonella sp.]|uniref:hypothetical protein n=1 Tax=Ideonella sp. TaxID=1929293 RepID=UPI002B6CE88F|nr:hypothetical protein [Ideonella sp.]HSI50409.1 hypothetical protein [Ideonella sp.]
MRLALAWMVLSAAAIFSLWCLNGAAFSAWMSGGPPNAYPHGWALRAQGQLAYAGAAAAAGVGLFRIIRGAQTWRRVSTGLLMAALVLAVWPSAHRALLQDKCLDSGGRWNHDGRQCER